MKKTVEVTKDDIATADRGDCFTCPIAKAVKRRFSLRHGVEVSNQKVWVTSCISHSHYTGYLPQEAQDFVRHFDKGMECSPFSFEIEFFKV